MRILEGEIDESGIVTRLAEIESLAVTGALGFESGQESGEVPLVRGQIAGDESLDEAVLEALLEAKEGRFWVEQRLPPLPVSGGDKRTRRGSLEVHVPADLMNYCEQAGLTGWLRLEQAPAKAELGYVAGELEGIRLDGIGELHDVFSWEQGSFEIGATIEQPSFGTSESGTFRRPKGERPDTTGEHFVKIVEVAMEEILKEREERRPASRTSPPRLPLPQASEHPTLQHKAVDRKQIRRRDPTVRVIYLGQNLETQNLATKEKSTSTTAKSSSEPPSEPANAPESKPSEPAKAASDRPAAKGDSTSLLGTLSAVAVTLIGILMALIVVALLPRVDGQVEEEEAPTTSGESFDEWLEESDEAWLDDVEEGAEADEIDDALGEDDGELSPFEALEREQEAAEQE